MTATAKVIRKCWLGDWKIVLTQKDKLENIQGVESELIGMADRMLAEHRETHRS